MNQPQTNPDPRKGGTSASNAAADLRCPARHLAQKPFPDTGGNKDTAHGRLIHACLADPGNRVIMDQLTVEQRETFDRCREIEKHLSLSLFPDQGREAPVRVFREQRYWVLVDGKFLHSGQPDVVMRSGPRGLILEYKTLPGDVPDSPENLQLRDQVVLAAGHLLLDEVSVAIVQPMVTMTPVIATYKREDIKKAEEEMFARVRLSNDPKSPRLAGEVQCKFCRAKNDCPEHNKFAGAMVPGMLSLLDVPVSAWTPEQRGFFCNQRKIAQKWLDDVEEAMKEGAAKDPNYITGWTLVPGAERRTVVDGQQVFVRFNALGGTPAAFMKCVSVQLGKLKTVVHDLTGARGKALDAAIDTLTDGLTETKRNAPSLKPKGEGDGEPKQIEP